MFLTFDQSLRKRQLRGFVSYSKKEAKRLCKEFGFTAGMLKGFS